MFHETRDRYPGYRLAEIAPGCLSALSLSRFFSLDARDYVFKNLHEILYGILYGILLYGILHKAQWR